MNNIQVLKNLKLDVLLNSPDILSCLPDNYSDDERLEYLFSETTHANVWVTDDDEIGYSVFVFDTKGTNKNKLLSLVNHSSRSVFLWAIDGKLFKKVSKCDCAIINDDNLHLVEFKANVVSNNIESIDEHYDKAFNQLSLTLNYLTDGFSISNHDIFEIFSDIDAMIVFDPTLPRDNAYQKKLIAQFNDKNCITLQFGNKLDL